MPTEEIEAIIEDYDFMIANGEWPERAARRLGLSPKNIQRKRRELRERRERDTGVVAGDSACA